jgi:tetratricopeptide (TPR) repeat protein
MVRKFCEVLGYTFDTVSKTLAELTKPVAFYTSMDHKGMDGGIISLKRLCWQVKCFLIIHADVPSAKAIAWLESLPDDEGFYQASMTLPTHDHGSLWGVNHQTCWLALAHEKVGLYEGALRFCRLALELDMLKAGVPSIKWALTIALACKGRVLMKFDRHIEALAAFRTAIATSKASYSMMEAFAYRELANFDITAGTPATVVEAAAQARHNLEEKLKEFDGRLTRAEFDTLSIAPP